MAEGGVSPDTPHVTTEQEKCAAEVSLMSGARKRPPRHKGDTDGQAFHVTSEPHSQKEPSPAYQK